MAKAFHNLKENYDLKDLIFGGPILVKQVGMSLSNLFWKETLVAFSKLCEAIPDAHPHMFFHLNIFKSKLFSGGGIFIEKADFPELWSRSLVQVGDFYDCERQPPAILSLTDLNEKYQIRLNFLRYLRIKTCIERAAKAVGNIFVKTKCDIMLPRLPLLFKIGCLENKGCQTFYLTLRSTEVNKCNLNQKAIDKWHEELGLEIDKIT